MTGENHQSPAPTDATVADDYQQRGNAHRAAHDRVERSARWVSRARLATFLIGAGAVVWLLSRGAAPKPVAYVVAIGLVVFSWLVRWHRRLSEAARLDAALANACDVGASRVLREWQRLPAAPVPGVTSRHAFAADLDLTGDVSLARLLGPTSAVAGRRVISEWVLAESPPDHARIEARQEAIAELAPRADWRERLGVLGHRAGHEASSMERLLLWAQSEDRLVGATRVWAARLLTLCTMAALVVVVVHPTWWRLLAGLCAANLMLTAVSYERLRAGHRDASAHGLGLDNVTAMFRHMMLEPFRAAALRELHDRAEPRRAAAAFGRLARIAGAGELRFSPMGHAILQTLTLWDFHVVHALDEWRRADGRFTRQWMRALGELEALSALATLAHDNPAWTYPTFDGGSTVVEAIALAHPLLSAATRVPNDVAVGPAGTFLLVTGSNMAGKSTLLRSVGLNVVLAQLGAPVCATTFRMPRVRLRTSMRVHDVLAEGLSLFMAELLRLKAIVDAALEPTGPVLLYLADEMLHGTNIGERRIAVVAVIDHLLRAGAIGAVATHDVELAKEPSLASAARPIHFVEQYRESASGPVMSFDYRARPGLATSSNALKLLGLVGLDAGRDAGRG